MHHLKSNLHMLGIKGAGAPLAVFARLDLTAPQLPEADLRTAALALANCIEAALHELPDSTCPSASPPAGSYRLRSDCSSSS